MNEKIEAILDIVIDEIRKDIPDLKSVIVGGSFGRKEGSVVVDREGIHPINDFDVFAITEKPYPEEVLNRIGLRASKKIGKKGIISFKRFDKRKLADLRKYFYVDLKAIPLEKLKKLPPMIRYYELKNASLTVYGDDVYDKFPDFKIEDLPLAEGIRLLLNRMSHLIEFFFPEFVTKEKNEIAHQHFLMHAIKIFNDSAGALLLLNGKYVPTYVQRAQMIVKTFDKDFPQLKKVMPSYTKRVREFSNLKVKMDFSAYSNKDFELWTDSRFYIGEVAKYYVSKFTGKDIWDWDEFSKVFYRDVVKNYYKPYLMYSFRIPGFVAAVLSPFVQYYLNILYFLRIKREFGRVHLPCLLKIRSPELTFFSAAPLIIFSLKDDGTVDLEMLERGRKLLGKTFPVDAKYKGADIKYWEEIAHSYANAYILFAFLKIV
ncbi:MAG: hypothetical protein ABH829_02840 [archaeon]